MNIEGAIFDMDGVLLDNVSHHLRAWRKLGREQGKSLTDDAIRATFGQRNQEMLQALIGQDLTLEECRRLADRKEELYREAVAPELESAMVPGLREFLRELRQAGCRTAVATSGPLENVRFVEQGLGLADTFDAVITSADVQRGKPHPDVFLVAARRLGVPAKQCVVFEDSASGVRAALAAGCHCVALATTHSRQELRQWQPHWITPDFRGLGLQQLGRELLAGRV